MRSGRAPSALCVALALVACGRRNFNVDADTDIDGPEGDRANYVFVTSSVHPGNLGGLPGADGICAMRAGEAGLPGTYVAFLSTVDVDAVTRLAGSRGWQRVDGQPVADLPAQLTGLRTWYPIAFDEVGQDVRLGGDLTWTGTFANGASSADTCSQWSTSPPGAKGTVGSADAGGARLFNVAGDPCDDPRHLYCFELGGVRTIAPPAMTTGRLAFVTSAAWPPTGGQTAATTLCQSEATAAGRAGTFRAALPLVSATTASQFSTGGAPWVRADGALIATGTDMFAGNASATHVGMTATGAALPAYTSIWAGDPQMLALTNCADWTSASILDFATIGAAEATGTDHRFVNDSSTCNGSHHLLCLEE